MGLILGFGFGVRGPLVRRQKKVSGTASGCHVVASWMDPRFCSLLGFLLSALENHNSNSRSDGHGSSASAALSGRTCQVLSSSTKMAKCIKVRILFRLLT